MSKKSFLTFNLTNGFYVTKLDNAKEWAASDGGWYLNTHKSETARGKVLKEEVYKDRVYILRDYSVVIPDPQ
jgi:hypothetical protein